ncbi:hypothetical protein PRIPAC_79282 [Pristionchus pacificus]|uniref:G protein-coupled receptor n=1 Tax=Pristionchus pacificus TaxID=54126 RepID=A0A2A6CQB8_PRIPA|nr:hypothetical protein PRIPAC_79282 [Pristionchus pacificus]|eukprot:PDM80231.1 G protein-coupled receptor [Pristionchus pacificus]
MSAPLLLAVVHYNMCILGTVFNAVTLAVIAMQTPKTLTCYAVTLFSQTLLLMLTCIASGVHFARIIPNGISTFVVSSGPVHLFRQVTMLLPLSVEMGFYFECFLLHGHSHYCTMLAECFVYRYYVFVRPPPSFRAIWLLVLLVYLPTAVIFSWAASSASLLDEATARAILAPRGSSYVFDDDVLVVGISSVLEPCNLTGIFWVSGLWIPCYAVIILNGSLMYRTLLTNTRSYRMSERTRAMQRDIAMGLVVQACLPVMYGVSALMFAIGQINERSVVEVEYLTHMAGEVCLMLTPLTTLYFVQPYRQTIVQLVYKKKVLPQSYYTSINELK